jgi:hypothetical protein
MDAMDKVVACHGWDNSLFGLQITLRMFWQMIRIADFTCRPLKVSIGHPSASLRHHGRFVNVDFFHP